MNIYQTVGRNSLLKYLDQYMESIDSFVNDKNNSLYGKGNKIKMFLFNSINSRHLMDDKNDYVLIHCSNKFEEFVVYMEKQ